MPFSEHDLHPVAERSRFDLGEAQRRHLARRLRQAARTIDAFRGVRVLDVRQHVHLVPAVAEITPRDVADVCGRR
jgi:hypothetical protein